MGTYDSSFLFLFWRSNMTSVFCTTEIILAWIRKQEPDMTADEMIGVLTAAANKQQDDGDVSSPLPDT